MAPVHSVRLSPSLTKFIYLIQDGDRFWRLPEAYVRGNTIKYLRVPDEVLDKAKESDLRRADKRPMGYRGRGRGRGGVGRGDSSGRGDGVRGGRGGRY